MINAPGAQLNIGHFFSGMMDREEVASAFIAMALEGIPSFRRHFFDTLGSTLGEGLSKHIWSVVVEQDRVDIRMESSDAVILIENKLRSGAKQQGQLLKYFREACGGSH